jgi:hypothetical protein
MGASIETDGCTDEPETGAMKIVGASMRLHGRADEPPDACP